MDTKDIASLSERLAGANARDLQEQHAILGEIRAVRKELERSAYRDLIACVDAAALLTEYLTRMGCIGPEGILRVVSQLMQAVHTNIVSVGGAPCAPPRMEKFRPLSKIRPTAPAGVDPAPVHVAPDPQPSRVVSDAYSDSYARSSKAEADEYEAADESLADEQHELLTSEDAKNDLELVSDRVLGELLVELRVIDRSQIAKALGVQRATGIRIGEAFVEIGAATWSQIENALTVQNSMRKGPLRSERSGRA